MAEFTVRVWRRTRPLVGDPTRIQSLERDEVSLEAASLKDALEKVVEAEYKEGGKRLRIYAQIERPEGGHLGIGDYTLCELAFKEDEARRTKTGTETEKK